MEQALPDLEQKQMHVSSLMTWFGWDKAPFARDLEHKEGVDLQAPIRKAGQLKKEVEEAKEALEADKEASVTIELPRITTDKEIEGYKKVGTEVRSKGKVIHRRRTLLPSTRELFQKTAEVLVNQFGFTVPERTEKASFYPTNDPKVFVRLGDLSNRFKGKPLEGVSLVVQKTS